MSYIHRENKSNRQNLFYETDGLPTALRRQVRWNLLNSLFQLLNLSINIVGWHHQFNGHELEQTAGDGEGQGGLVCCSPWCHKESDMTWRLNNNNINIGCKIIILAVDARAPLRDRKCLIEESTWYEHYEIWKKKASLTIKLKQRAKQISTWKKRERERDQ